MNESYIALGSNMGNRQQYLQKALHQIEQLQDTTVQQVSSIYETKPIGYTKQDAFLNMVVSIETNLSPYLLLRNLQRIERNLDRQRGIHWGPRTIDLDILLYNQENIQSEDLKIPHPRMIERGFVMIPLYELQSDLEIPHTNEKLSRIIKERINKEGVIIWKENNGVGEFGLFES